MGNTIYDINAMRNIILGSQHLLKKSSDSIEDIVSDICGLQYDPYPAIHLNQYIMLWNRKKDFRPEQLDIAAYNPEVQAAEKQLRESLIEFDGLTANQIWENLNLSFEWNKYRREHDQSYNLPIFRAFYRLIRRGDLLTCGRKPGTFREPVFILKEKVGFSDWSKDSIDEKQAIKCIVEKLIVALAVTDPVHVSHISGYKTADILPVFAELEAEKKIVQLPYKFGRKCYYIHSSKIELLNEKVAEDCSEVRLISPMDTVVRDKAWLETFFDYSFSFEYFKKKGMKWPLSILVGNQFVGYLDCKMDWKTQNFIIKERNIFNSDFIDYKGIDVAIEELAAFHEAKEIIEK